MNSKVLIILIILVLIVLMLCLITKKPIKENFFEADICTGVTEKVNCDKLVNGCSWDAEASACNEDCLFDPVSRDADKTVNLDICTGVDQTECKAPPHTNYCFWDTNAGKCFYKRSGKESGKFAGENEDVESAFKTCFTECNGDTWNNSSTTVAGREVNGYSRCTDKKCTDKCILYKTERAKATAKKDISYDNYPTDHVSRDDYEKIKKKIIDALDDDTNILTKQFKAKLYKDSNVCSDYNKNNNECNAQPMCKYNEIDNTCRSNESEKVNKIMQALAKLNNSGNDFAQQIGQLGEFQEKYSDKIEEILEGRAEKDPTEEYIKALESKLKEVDNIFNKEFGNAFGNTNLEDLLESPHGSITCIANNITLNLTPVKYTKDTGETYYPKGVGAYMINLDGTNLGVDEHLYYYSYNSADKNPPKQRCVIGDDTACDKWTLVNTTRYNTAGGGNANGATVIQQDEKWEELQKRDGFFWIIQINSEKDYNSILIKNNIDSILKPTDSSIKYPFYIVESARRPGYLLNVKTDGYRKVTVERANNNGTEKFTASPAPTAKCISYQ